MRQIVGTTCLYLADGCQQLWCFNLVNGPRAKDREDVAAQTPFNILNVTGYPCMALLLEPLQGNHFQRTRLCDQFGLLLCLARSRRVNS